MKVITAYQTQDEAIFLTTYEAELHERQLRRRKSIDELISGVLWEHFPFPGGECERAELVGWLLANKDALLEVLE